MSYILSVLHWTYYLRVKMSVYISMLLDWIGGGAIGIADDSHESLVIRWSGAPIR